MTDSSTRPLFRPEAVEAHARGRGVADDEGLDLKEGQTFWAFRLLVLALALALAVALTVKVEETARGNAEFVRGSDTAEILVPAGAAVRLRPGQQVRLNDARGTVVAIGTSTTQEEGRLLVTVRARFTEGRPTPGEAVIRLTRRTVLELLLGRNA